MLGIPLVTLSSGFFPSIIPLLIGWIYMYSSGLMLLEIYLGKRKNINLMGLLESSLGRAAKIIGAFLFMFLFYSILTAYLNASSILIQDSLASIFNIYISQGVSLIVNAVFLSLIILFGTRQVDFINRFLVALMFVFYLCLIGLGLCQVEMKYITISPRIDTVLWAVPLFIVSFGFQNLIPTISYYLKYNAKSIKAALFRGSVFSLIIYLIWNFVISGMIATSEQKTFESSTTFLIKLFNAPAPKVAFFINGFSLLAIVTSLLTVSLSFVNFISDSSENREHRLFYIACVIIPPAAFSLLNPNVFCLALHLAGGIGAICLFGILPALMLWRTRYIQKKHYKRVFPLGKGALVAYLLVSLAIISIEIIHLFI